MRGANCSGKMYRALNILFAHPREPATAAAPVLLAAADDQFMNPLDGEKELNTNRFPNCVMMMGASV